MARGKQQLPRRAFWFVSILFVLVIGTAITGATLSIRSSENAMLRDVRSGMDAEARNKVAALTVWSGGLRNQVAGLTGTDMFRLFASEVNDLGNGITDFLKAVERKREFSDASSMELASQLPLMRKILQDFVSFSGFSSARTLNRTLQDYLFTGPKAEPLTQEQKQVAADVLETGKNLIVPARMTEKGLVMDILFPVFAPKYVSTEDKPVSVFMVTVSVMEKVRELTQASEDSPSGATRVLQETGSQLEELRPDGSLVAIQGWKSEDGELPLAIRRFDTSSPSLYTLGFDVPEMPWMLVQAMKQDKAQSDFETHRTVVILIASGGALFGVLLLGGVWWWLVWRRERTVSREIAVLYETVNQQKQLLDGINSAFPVGLVLTDANGIIRYVNTAFAAMKGHAEATLLGLSAVSMLEGHAAEALGRHIQAAFQKGTMTPFTTELQLDGEKQHYQIVCAPFLDEEQAITGVVSAFQNITDVVTAQERSQRMIQQTISVLVRAIEAVDPYLRGQSTFTGMLAGQMVQDLGLASIDKETVLTAANLFQIGMIQLPHKLLTKQGQLTPEERTQLERHVDYARGVLSGMDFGMPVLETICQMYERLDGSGYPEKLAGEAICIHARVLAVSNTFCALIRPRSYRMERSVPEALDILSEEPPRFDPQIVALLRAFLLTQGGKNFVENLQKMNV